MSEIIVFGGVNLDQVVYLPRPPKEGETLEGQSVQTFLGGKGANIVFADADEKAIKRGIRRVFNNSGQSCNAPTRMLVEKSIYERAVKEAIEVADKTNVDIAEKNGNHIGPVVSKTQYFC